MTITASPHWPRGTSSACQGRRGHARTTAAQGGGEVRNNADSLVYQTEKLLKDQGEKFQGDERRSDRPSPPEESLAVPIRGHQTSTRPSSRRAKSFSQRLYEEAAKENQSAPAVSPGRRRTSDTSRGRRDRRRQELIPMTGTKRFWS